MKSAVVGQVPGSATKLTVKVATMDSVGPRPVEELTRASVVRDYLRAWETMDLALQQNRPELLDESFIGGAKQTLTDTIREQEKLRVQSAYGIESHDLQVVFYSPEGLSIEIVDTAVYEVEVRDHEKVVGRKQVQARYFAVMTPTESKWKVRVLQGGS